MFNIKNVVESAKHMQEKMATAKQELEKQIFQGQSANNQITVKINGRLEVLDVKIEPSNNSITLESATAEAINDCLNKFKHYQKHNNPMSQMDGIDSLDGLKNFFK